MHIVVFGGGMQGKVIARNLLLRNEKPKVTIADLQKPANLHTGVDFVQCNVLDAQQVNSVLKGADAAVLAVPSQISRAALTNLLQVGIPVTDVCFTPDPPLDLDAIAKKSGACCVVDCGIAPGMSHILAGAAYAELDGLDTLRILVGGMPQNPPPVFKHAIYFNPHDLLAEYVRPARARMSGKEINPAPMEAEVENYQDKELGKLDAFISDGLRSLLTSYTDIPNMSEYTLRLPGHLETMRNLHEMGLFDEPTFQAVGSAFGAKYPADKFDDVFLLVVEAKKGNKQLAWRVLDKRTNNESAMSRCTGYTTAAVAMCLAKRQFSEVGVHAPERLGHDLALTKAVIADLAEHGVKIETLVPALV